MRRKRRRRRRLSRLSPGPTYVQLCKGNAELWALQQRQADGVAALVRLDGDNVVKDGAQHFAADGEWKGSRGEGWGR